MFGDPSPAPGPTESAPTDDKLARSILVVEDESNVRTVLQRVLTEDGYRVLSASNAEYALNLIRDTRLTLDAMVSDVVLPGMHGPELARQALIARPGLRILLMSGYAPPQLMVGSEAIPILNKPFGHRALQRALDQLFSGA